MGVTPYFSRNNLDEVAGALETALVCNLYDTAAALCKKAEGHGKSVLLKILGGSQTKHFLKIPLAFTFAYISLFCKLFHADGFLVMAVEIV